LHIENRCLKHQQKVRSIIRVFRHHSPGDGINGLTPRFLAINSGPPRQVSADNQAQAMLGARALATGARASRVAVQAGDAANTY